MKPFCLKRNDDGYPAFLPRQLGDTTPSYLYALGDAAVLERRLVGFLCSVKCPGSVVIQALEGARSLRDAGVAVAGAFHSPMERECLDIVLRGEQPVVICAAKGLKGLRIGPEARQALSDGRALLLSPFDDSVRRTTSAQAATRNDLVAALGEALWVPHASPGGRTWAAVRAALDRGQRVFTFEDGENEELMQAGARPFGELLSMVAEW